MICTRKSLLVFLSSKCSDPRHTARLLEISESPESLKSTRPRLVDLLRECPSLKLTAEELVHCLTPSHPRFYSVASSPLEFPDTIHIAFAVVDWQTADGQSRDGVCTSWLRRCHDSHHYNQMLVAKDSLSTKDKALSSPTPSGTDAAVGDPIKVPLFLRPSAEFRMPVDPATPMICICAGTGIAPFRGFFAHRAAMVASGKVEKSVLGLSWLLFGCKSKFVDYLYCDDLAKFQKDGYLTHNHVAFSLSDVSSPCPL
jgi:sulfite reductase alpha subunit-like flavoprotein